MNWNNLKDNEKILKYYIFFKYKINEKIEFKSIGLMKN